MSRIRVSAAALLAAAVLLAPVGLRGQLMPPDGAARITQHDFKQLRASGQVIIVDTRNLDVYRLGHIPGARLLPLEGLPTWPAEYESLVATLKAATVPIVTYCA